MAFHAPIAHAVVSTFHPDVQVVTAHFSTPTPAPTPQEPFKIPTFPKAPPKPNSFGGDISMISVGHESSIAVNHTTFSGLGTIF